MSGVDELVTAAMHLVIAYDRNLDAINGQGHPGEPHDQAIHIDPCTGDPDVHMYSNSTDCAACGAAEYETDDDVQQAVVDVKVALGLSLRTYEEWRAREPEPVE